MEDSNRMMALLLGVGVGAAVATLFAPKSGSETRTYLQTKSRDAMDALRSGGEDLRQKANDVVESGKEMLRGQAHNAGAAKQTFRGEVGQSS